MLSENEIIATLSKTGALLTGHFQLRSGLHSGDFFQCANLLRHPREAQRLCEAMARLPPPELLDRVETVAAPALGGIIVGHEVARALGKLSIFAEKEDGKLVMRRFSLREGERVLIAEDVVTRGGRVRETIALVRAAGAEPVAVVTLVDRSGGTAGFDIPHFSLLRQSPRNWTAEECPLCREGVPLVRPGS